MALKVEGHADHCDHHRHLYQRPNNSPNAAPRKLIPNTDSITAIAGAHLLEAVQVCGLGQHESKSGEKRNCQKNKDTFRRCARAKRS